MSRLNFKASGIATVLASALVAGVLATPAPAQATRDDKMPAAGDIFQKMAKALGGEAALRKHKHQTLTGTLGIPAMGASGSLMLYGSAPNFRLVEIEIPNMGSVSSGYDGTIAWSINPQTGPQIMEGAQREQAVYQADFYSSLNYMKNYKNIEVAGTEEFNDKDCYKLTMETKEGSPLTLYIDTETHLPAGTESEMDGGMGPMTLTVYFEEYKEFDGEMIAVETRQDFGGMMEQVITFESVTFEPIDKSRYDLPEVIATMVEESTPASQPGG